ncbi:MAG: ComF family protein [Dehalococcoidia bacterium]
MALQTRLAQIPEAFLDLLFPLRCIGCGMEGGLICPSCTRGFPPLPSPFCERCGLPLKGAASCPKCNANPLQINGIRSIFLHEKLARDAIHTLKYNNLKSLAGPLANFMARYLQSNPLPADVLVPVPMHSKRLRRRGYNQAQLLAKELGKLMGLPLSSTSLVRVTNTTSQVALKAQGRQANVAGAFSCKDNDLAGKRVLLIDDVCTTGATLNACAISLKAAGAASVWGLTLSREL